MTGEEAKQILLEATNQINAFMSKEKWLEAHSACLEILRFDPENLKVIHLKNKIKKIVKKINQKAIKQDLDNLKPLWQEQRYAELLSNLDQLQPYIPEYPQLQKVIVKAQKLYKKQMEGEHHEYIKQEQLEIQKLRENGDFQAAVRKAEKLRILAIDEQKIKNLLRDIRTQWLNSEIQKKKSLLESKMYEDTLIFLQGLYRIDKGSAKIKKLLEDTKNRYRQYKIQQKRDIIYRELERVKTLYQLKKYLPCMESAQQILEIDPTNKEALYYFKHAKNHAKKMQNKDLYKQIKNSANQMKDEYRKDKTPFIRI